MTDQMLFGYYWSLTSLIRAPNGVVNRKELIATLRQEFFAKPDTWQTDISSACYAAIVGWNKFQQQQSEAERYRADENIRRQLDGRDPPQLVVLKEYEDFVKRYQIQIEITIRAAAKLKRVYGEQEAPQSDKQYVNHWLSQLVEELSWARNMLQHRLGKFRKLEKIPDLGGTRDEIVRQKQRDLFTSDPLGMPTSDAKWVFVQDLKGGISRAGVFVQLDENDIVVDRIVKKNDYSTANKWTDSRNWHGDAKDLENRVPIEFWLQNKCADASPDHFAKLRSWGQDHRRFIISQYVEYCPLGDLAGIQGHYQQMRVYQPRLCIPEPAMWMIFLRLVEACLVMRQGSVLKSDAQSDWKEIVHRDLKPNNIFLDKPQAARFPRYAMPKMADFGLAFETTANDPLNPKLYNHGAGTPGFTSPEQLRFRNSRTHEPVDEWLLLAHTNVYGIGATMWELMSPRHFGQANQPTFLDPSTRWKVSDWTRERYSETLWTQIDSCVNWDPSHRPTLDGLHKFIRGLIDHKELRVDEDDKFEFNQKFEYLKSAENGDQPASSKYTLLVKNESYKLGLVLNSDGNPPTERFSQMGL